MKRLLILLFLPLLALAACETVKTPRERLVATELTYQAVLQRVGDLVDRGLIKGQKAAIVNTSRRTMDAAMEAWRANPDDPSLVQAATDAIAQLTRLLDLFVKPVAILVVTPGRALA